MLWKERAIFTKEVLAVALQQLSDLNPVPRLFMRTLIHSLVVQLFCHSYTSLCCVADMPCSDSLRYDLALKVGRSWIPSDCLLSCCRSANAFGTMRFFGKASFDVLRWLLLTLIPSCCNSRGLNLKMCAIL
jgi:hypothetical protein